MFKIQEEGWAYTTCVGSFQLFCIRFFEIPRFEAFVLGCIEVDVLQCFVEIFILQHV